MSHFAIIARVLLLTMLTSLASASSFDDLLGFMARNGLALADGESPDRIAVDAVLQQIDPGYHFIEEGEPLASAPTNEAARVPLEMWSARLAYVAPGRLDPAGVAWLDGSLASIAIRQLDGLILDLRGCSGGSLDEAVAVASRFVPSGIDLASQTRRRLPLASVRSRVWRAGGDGYTGADYRCAVLTDARTAGAAEALAAILQSFDPCLVVGQPTAGTLAAREELPYGKGTLLAIATADLQIGRRCYRPGDPVVPDLPVNAAATYRGTSRASRGTLDREPSDEAVNDEALMQHVGGDATVGKAIDILLAMRAISAPMVWRAPPAGEAL